MEVSKVFSGTHKYWKIFHAHSIFLIICPGSKKVICSQWYFKKGTTLLSADQTFNHRSMLEKLKDSNMCYLRGLFRDGMTKDGTNGNCDDATSMQFVLSECIDFKLQKTAIAELLEQRGHLCDFLLKYHPELSPIERCWAVFKRYFRTRGKFNYADMIRKLKISLLDQTVQL